MSFPIRPTAQLRVASPELSEAEALFAHAKADYETRRFAEAARGFPAVARLLRLAGPYADGFTGNRRFCYRNAASAFSGGGRHSWRTRRAVGGCTRTSSLRRHAESAEGQFSPASELV